ncbi:MAG: SH3 domain-containing protein [Anaerolineales bacterium]|nr:SH3 domain-containing protein [Anaerolineales bacterium]
MRNRQWINAAVFLLILSACNLPTSASPSSTVSAPTLTQTRVPPRTPTVTFTATPFFVVAFTKNQTINCRSGPGTAYTVIGELRPGRQAEIVGKNIDVTWWYVKNPSDPSTFCWLAVDFVLTDGNVEALPVVNPPVVTVSAVRVSVEPAVINAACDAFPQLVTINVRISVSGPSIVVWRWEEVETGEISEEQTLLFEEGGTKTVQDLYKVNGARDYTMLVRTLQPNEAMGKTTFKAVCTP